MAISFVGSAVGNHNSGTLTVNLPGGVAQDDLVLVFADSDASSGTEHVPTTSGYTQLADLTGTFGDQKVYAGYKKMGASPDASVAWPTASHNVSAAVMVFRGVDTTTPIDATTVTSTPGGSGTPDNPAITTVTNNAAVVAIAGSYASSTSASLTGYGDVTKSFRVQASTAGAWMTKATAGSEDPPAWSSWSSEERCMVTVALRPSATAPQTLTPSLFTNTNTFYAAIVGRGAINLQPSLFSDADTFYSPNVKRVLKPSLYVDADTFSSATITRGAVNLSPSLYTDADIFYSATVGRGTVNLSPSLYVDADTFYTPVVTYLNLVTPSLYSDADVFYSATVLPGSVTLTPSLYVDADTFYEPTVQGDIRPTLYVDPDTFYSATVTANNTLLPALYVDPDTFYSEHVYHNVTPDLFINTNTFYDFTTEQFAVRDAPFRFERRQINSYQLPIYKRLRG